MEELKEQTEDVPTEGFSLIELLIAIAILSVAIIGIVALLPTGYSQITSAGRISVMNHLGQQKLDQLRDLNYSDVNLTDGTHPTYGPERVSYIGSDGSNIYDDYTITWEVRDNLPQNNMKTVIVTVGHQLYDSGDNLIDEEDAMNQKSIKFQTFISD